MSADLARGLRISLAVHTILLVLLLGAGATGREGRPPVLIDFTLVEPPRSSPDRPAPASRPPSSPSTAPAAAALPPAPAPHVAVSLAPPEPVPHPPPQPVATLPPTEPASPSPPPPSAAPPLSEPQVHAPAAAEARPPLPPEASETVSFAALPSAGSSGAPSPEDAGSRVGDATGDKIPGSGSGGESAERIRAKYLERHYGYIREVIQRRIEYPMTARRMGWEGRVVVAFTIRADGTVRDVRVKESSGFPLLDRNAVEAVRGASPYPKPPAEAQILTPIVYTLR